MSQRVVIAGLGNPGPQYAMNRHNIGFWAVDGLAKQLGWVFHKSAAAYLEAVGEISGIKLSLLKPLTYMNRSGLAIQAMAAQNHLALADPPDNPTLSFPLLVICDDLNLPLGAVRLRPGGRSGGQNGLADIIEAVGTESFARLRLGISPLEGEVDPQEWADFVLANFTPAEIPIVDDTVQKSIKASMDWLLHGVEYAASRHNRRSYIQSDDA